MMKKIFSKVKEATGEAVSDVVNIAQNVTKEATNVITKHQDSNMLKENQEERVWSTVELKEEYERCDKIIADYESKNPGVLRLGLRKNNKNPGISLMSVKKLVDNKIVVPDFVTGIAKFGVWNTDDDITIELGNGITDYEEIFSGSEFRNLDLSNWDPNKIQSLSKMFVSAKITNLKGLGKWDITKHKDLSQMFRKCQITKIDGINNWDVSKVENITLMFSEAKITSLDISKWNIKSLITTPNTSNTFGSSCAVFRNAEIEMFGGLNNWNVSKLNCLIGWFNGASIYELDLSNWDVSNVKTMQFLFEKFQGKLVINNWNVSKVENMSKMFCNIKTTAKIDVDKWNVSNVVNMEKLFMNATMADINISNWNVSNVINMESLFDNSKINSVGDLSNWNTKKVNNMSFAFKNPAFKSVGLIGKWNVCNCDVTQMFYKAQIDDIGSISLWKNNIHQEHMFQASSLLRG